MRDEPLKWTLCDKHTWPGYSFCPMCRIEELEGFLSDSNIRNSKLDDRIEELESAVKEKAANGDYPEYALTQINMDLREKNRQLKELLRPKKAPHPWRR